MELRGGKVLITGGGRGVGAHIAREMSRRGARPIIVGRSEKTLRETAASFGGKGEVCVADLSDRDAVDALVARLIAEHPDLVGLVNNAAVQHEIDLVAGDANDNVRRAREEIAINLDGSIALAVRLLPVLCRAEAAFVANITSGLAFAPKEATPVYCAAKAGLHTFSEALRYQCERSVPSMLVCEAILPLVDTDMTRGRGRGKMSPQNAARAIVDGIAAGRPRIWVGKAKLLPLLRRLAPSG